MSRIEPNLFLQNRVKYLQCSNCYRQDVSLQEIDCVSVWFPFLNIIGAYTLYNIFITAVDLLFYIKYWYNILLNNNICENYFNFNCLNATVKPCLISFVIVRFDIFQLNFSFRVLLNGKLPQFYCHCP